MTMQLDFIAKSTIEKKELEKTVIEADNAKARVIMIHEEFIN